MTTLFNAPDWRKLSQHERNRDLNKSEAVNGSRAIATGWDT